MESMVNVIKSRWFITLVGVLALSLIVWLVGPLIAIAEYKPLARDWVRMLTIMLLLLLWGGINLYKISKAKAAESGLSHGIADNDNAAVGNHDLSAVKSQFTEALETLKKASGKTKGNKNYLYELPWYLLIGPPGSGKTTALVNSGLDFPLEDKFGKNSIKGVAGTRHCDWWFTNDAVLIDTAGRYTTQDSHAQADRAEWQRFIELLKKYRKRRPINGVMVAVSVQDILSKTAVEKETQIKAIRARLQEIIDDLGVYVPVYLIFTKCDLVEGFNETFESLSKELRQQVWGMTFADNTHTADVNFQERFETEYLNLMERLQTQQLSKFYVERDVQRRSKIINFPHQLYSLKEQLSEFVGRAFSDSRFHDQFFLRGIYFTSGTQDSTALNRAITQMANPLGIQARQLYQHSQQGRSYFLKDLLHKVIFQEADLVGVNKKQEIVSRWLRGATLVSCLVVLVLAGFGLSTSFGRNQLFLASVETLTKDYSGAVATLNEGSLPIDLLPVFQLNESMQRVFPEPELLLDLGLYQGNKIASALKINADRLTHQMFLMALTNELEQAIKANLNNPSKLWNVLKAYLMIGDAEHYDKDYVSGWLSNYWKNKQFDQPEKLAQLNHRTATLLAEFPNAAINDTLVATARQVIRQIPLSEQVYAAIQFAGEQNYSSAFRFPQAVGSDFHRVFDQAEHQIPRFYTYEGYNSVFKPGLEKTIEELADDNWVVGTDQGDLTELDLAEVQAKVEKRYYEEYIAKWEKHLYSVTLKSSKSLSDTAAFIDAIRSGRSPLRGVLEEVSLNTQLTLSLVSEEEVKENLHNAQQVARVMDPRAAKLARIARLASKSRFASMPENTTLLVDKRFAEIHQFVEPKGNRPAKIDGLMADLAELQFYVEAILNSGAQSESAYQAALKRYSGMKQDILSKIRMKARHYPEPLKQWMTKLNDTVWQQVLVQAHGYIATEYRHSLLPVYQRSIENHYPFNKGSNQEATLYDFTEFFKKDGVADIFFNEFLKAFVDTSSKPWRLKAVDGYTIGINRHYLGQFEKVDKIRHVFFDRESEPNVSFSIRPTYLDANVSRFELSMMGRRQVYRHGPPQLQEIVWPASQIDASISYQFEDYYNAKAGDRMDGPWSLFRFIDKYPLKHSQHGNRYRLTLENNGQKAVYELIAASAHNPLGQEYLSNFRLPGSL